MIEINRTAVNIGILIWAILLLVVVFLNSKGRIHFGWGLGDVFISIFITIIVLIVGVYTLIKIRTGIEDYLKVDEVVVYSFAALFFILILLKMTFLRGAESPWNGQVFF